MENLKKMSAQEARQMALESHSLENHIFREILEAAKNNRNRIFWDIQGYILESVNNLITTLRELGYTVSKFDNDSVLKITW